MKALAAALVEAQKKMPVVHKTGSSHHGPYATLDAIIEKTRPVLNANGLAIAQFPSETQNGQPGLRTVLLHAESGEQIDATVPLLLNGKNDMQALGGAITYARRYGWAAVLGIANDEDDDGNRASAPGTGAHKVAGGQQGAASSGGASAAAPTSSDGWKWTSGKHDGKTLAETPRSYIEWYAENGPKQDAKEQCRAFLLGGELEAVGATLDDDIPFDRTIDGLGN